MISPSIESYGSFRDLTVGKRQKLFCKISKKMSPTKVFKSSRPNRKLFEFFEKFQLWKIFFQSNMNPEARLIGLAHKFKALTFFFEKI